MNLTLVQILVAVSLAFILFISLMLAALNKDTESIQLRKKRLRELEELKQQIKEDLECLLESSSKELEEKNQGAKGDGGLKKL